jgi:undecaprenyl-diphosphatase
MTGAAPRFSVAALRSRVSPVTWFWLQMLAGAVVFAGASSIFYHLAEDVVRGDPITVLDQRLATWFHVHAQESLTQLMIAVSATHGIAGVSVLTLAFCLYLAWRRQVYWLIATVGAIPGGMLLNVLVKLAFHRPRPVFPDPLVTLTTYSFPSGHTLGATVFYGTLTAYLLTRAWSSAARVSIVILAVIMVTLVALSRMYLGAHFLSDVLAAGAEGVAWVAVCLMAAATLQRRQSYRPAAAP